MAHPVQQQVQRVGRQARRLLLLYGLSGVIAVVLAAALLVGLVDYLLRYQDVGLRLIGSGAVLLVLISSAFP